MSGDALNIHATGLVVGGFGLAILGPSGTGKSMLAVELVRRARAAGRHGFLVADDRLWVTSAAGRLVMRAPREIAGLIEQRGFGPRAVDALDAALLDRLVRLVPEEDAPRLADPSLESLHGIGLPRLDLPRRSTAPAAEAVLAWLDLPL